MAARARRRLKQFGRISAPLGFLITATSLIILNTAIAAGNPFKVVNAEITDRSTGVEASIGSFTDTKISSDVTFYQLGDSVSYAVTLANNGGQDILINSITDDNSNSYISYIYNNHAGTELAAGDSLTLDIVAKYSTEIPDITARSQHLEVKFMIDYDELEEELDVPDTGVNTRKKADKHPVADPVVIAFMILGIILLVAGLAKSKVSIHTKALILILLGTIASTSVIKAAGSQVAFEFTNNIEIKSLLSITYTVDGEEKTEIINYGDILPLADPDKPGYDFDGWVDENGNPVDPANPITDDITITAILTARTDTVYTVYHELENLTKTGFDLDKTETFQGTTDTEVTPATRSYDGFIAPSTQTIIIKGDNSASVIYQYIRETYDVTIDPIDVIVTPANPATCAEGENPDECDPNAPINPVNPDDPTAPVDPIDPDDPLPYGTKIVLTAKDVEHYTFDHWSSSDSAINNKTDNPLVIIVTGPVDATPVYTGNPYTVTFNAESTEVSGTPTQASITTTYPALIGELPTVTNMTKIGYNFLGWYFEDGTTKLTSSFQPTENVTVYAHYEHVDTNFTINNRWPESPDSATMVNHEVEYVNCLIGDSILISTHIKDYSPRAVVNAASAATNPTCLEGGSYNLDYDWMLYELSFASDEYKGAASTTGNFPMDKQVTIAAATRNNYTFDHWESSYSNIDNIQNSTYSFTMPAEDITDVTPIYRARVTFNPSDLAEVVETHRDIIEGDVLGTLPNIINLDYRYEFDGWYTAATGGDEVTEDYVPAGNTTIFAHYTRKTAEYAVYHYVCDPDNITCDTIAHEDYDTANVGDEVTPDFYNFSSEYGNGLNNPSAKTTITIYENTPNIVEYIYTRKYFALTYDNSSCVANSGNCISGSSTAAGQIAYGDSVNVEAEEVEHYRFDRWIITGVDNVDTQSESANFEMPDGDVVVKPTYLGLNYSVVFEQSRPGEEVYGYINGNNYINTVYPNAIGALPTISNINDENYDFVGWFLDDVDGSQLTTNYVPHEETPVVAYAHYEQKRAQYTVKHYKMTTEGEYEVDPDDTDGPLTANVGTSVTPEVKEYDGFTAPATRAITIDADSEQNVVEYYYARKQTTVVFNKNNVAATGTTASQQARYGETITLNENSFALTGYKFVGWATSADGSVAYDDQDDFVGTAEGGEYELFAKWTPNTFTVIFHANSDEVSNPTAMADQVVTYDETTTLTPNVYEREHYKLMGWATSENGAKVYNDGADITNVISENNGELNLYAVWRERTAMLNTGSNVNAALKAVNADATTFTHYTGTPELDAIENKLDIALTTSNFPVYVWGDNDTIYWWSEAENVYMNANSGSMFNGTNFVSIDASGFDASTATNMQLMFIDTRNVENINISGWDTSNVTSMYAMFNRAGVNKENPVNVDLTELDVQNVLSFDQMFKETKFVTLDLSSWNVESVTNTRSMFSSMPNLTTLNISGFDLSGLGDTPLTLFQSNNPSVISGSLLTSPETITMDNVIFNKNMDRLFENQSKLTTLSINNIDTSRTTSMQSMFSGAWNLAALDATQFNTANVTNMYRMFTNANAITSLDVSGWDVSKVTDMDHMFDMSNLTSIDLSTWNTQSLAVIKGLFDYARNLETIYVGENFNITNATVQNSSMFRENTKLVGGAGTTFNGQMTNSGKTHGRIDEPCDGRPGLFTLKNSQYICFYANYEGANDTAGQYVAANTPTTLRANTFTRENYAFDGWNTEPDGTGATAYDDAGSIMVSSEYISGHLKTPIRLYAQWKLKTYTISFHPNMDDVTGAMTAQVVDAGSSLPLKANTYSKDHWRFLGWTTEPSDNITGAGELTAIDYVDQADIVNLTTDMDLYAKWLYRCRGFATDSWDTIVANLESNSTYYDATDVCEKVISMPDDNGATQDYTLRLINTSTPEECATEGFSQTGCGTVIEFGTMATLRRWNPTGTTAGGWKASELNGWLNSTFYDRMPEDLKNVIIPTYLIVSGNGQGQESPDITAADVNLNKIFLPTRKEFGKNASEDNAADHMRTWDFYTIAAHRNSYVTNRQGGGEWPRASWDRSARNNRTNLSTADAMGTENRVATYPVFRIGRKFTVSFDVGENGVASEATRDYATTAANYGTLPTVTVSNPDNYAFLYWRTEPNGGGDVIDSTTALTVTTNHTLYAQYRDISEPFAKLNDNNSFQYAIDALKDGATIERIVPGEYPEEWILTGCNGGTNCYEMQANDSPYKVIAWYDDNNAENKTLYYAAEYNKYILLPENSGSMFQRLREFDDKPDVKYIDMSKLDGRNTTSMAYMFIYTPSLEEVVLGEHFNSQNVQDFSYMFYGTPQLTKVDLEHIDTSSATDLSDMFYQSALSLETTEHFNIANFDVSNVVSFNSMFGYMPNLTNIDLSGWQTSNNVASYELMFTGDTRLVTANITGLKTNASTDISSIFQGTSALTMIIANTNFDGTPIAAQDNEEEDKTRFAFTGDETLVGGNGTTMESLREQGYDNNNNNNGLYARIDDPAHGRPGYFTLANPLVVTFDAGMGESTYNYIPGTDYGTLPTITNVPADQVFLGWYTAAEGGVKVNDNDTFVSDNAHTLYARYAYTTTIAFHANYDGAIETMESQIVPQGVEIQLNANEFSMRDLYEFDHWSVTADGTGTTYANGANITLPAVGPGVTVDLYAQWAERNAIVYHANGEGVDGVMPITYANYSGTFHLQPSDYSRAGYGFAGWSLEADGSETMYGPMQTVDLEGLGIKNLYAQWIAPTGTLQNFNCANLESGAKVALTDNRDGQVYTVAKLADGKCWTTENLRLDFSNLASGVTIDSSNTNNPSADFTARISSNPTSDEWSDGGNSVAAINRLNYNTTNIERGDEDARYSYGVYYNWYTATAGQGTFDSQEEDAQGDICPAGWRLPIGATGYTGTRATGGDYSDLKDAMNIPDEASDWRWRQYPLNFIHSGYYERDGDEDVITWRTSNTLISAGEYWTSSAHKNSNLFSITMRVHDNHYDVNGQQHKAKGFTVRCVNTSTHSLTLDTNDGTSHTLTQTGTSDNGNFVFTLPNYEPTRDGYEFAGWSTSPSATTADYQPGDNITATTANTTLYAVWVQPVTYTTTFNVGEGATLVGDATVTGVSTTGSYTFTLPSATKSGWGLVGWDTTANVISPAYQAGGEFTTSTENNTLYAIWEETCPSGNVCYYNNDGTGTIMQMHAVVAQERFNLASPSALREDYAFGGWSEWRGGTSPYGPNEKTFAPYDTWKLYAIWIQSSGTMQNWTGCNDLSTNETIALTDSRDGQIYTVARLHNDQCWMTANLRLNLATHGDQVNSTNTNNPTAGFLTTVNAKPASSTTWCNTDNKTCTEQVLYNSDNITDTTNSTHYLGGVYYNWFTATAGNGTYNLDGATVSGDICPAGWRLPANSDSNSEIYYLYQNRSHRPVLTPTYYPFMLPQEGYYDGNSVVSRGTGGFAWGSTAGYHTAVYLGEENGEVNNWNKKPQYDGLSVRCLAK